MASKKIQAVLYRRFSDRSQAKGTSLKRQDRLAKEWCAKNNAEIIDVQTDAGVSAFRGKHAEIGALSTIITAIETGQIPEGSYLLIENVDRLGRDQISAAQSRFSSILELGVNIVTLQDGKVFTRDTLNDMGDIIWLVVTMARANEESATKSSRTQRAWEHTKERLLAGDKPKLKCPIWLEYDNSKKEYILNDKAKIIVAIFDIYSETLSLTMTAKQLNSMGVSTFRGASEWSGSSVRSIIDKKSTYGVLEHRDVTIEDFYPAAVSKDKYYAAQTLRKSKAQKTGATRHDKTSNLLTGIAKCGVCGSSLFLHGKERWVKAGYIESYKYLTCSKSRHSEPENKCLLPSFRYKHIEMILAFILSQLDNLPANVEKDRKGYITAKIEGLQLELKELAEHESVLIDMAMQSPSPVLKEKQATLASRQVEVKKEIDSYNRELAEIALPHNDNVKERMSVAVNKLNNDENYRQKVAHVLSRVIKLCLFKPDRSIELNVNGNTIDVNMVQGRALIKIENKVIEVKFP